MNKSVHSLVTLWCTMVFVVACPFSVLANHAGMQTVDGSIDAASTNGVDAFFAALQAELGADTSLLYEAVERGSANAIDTYLIKVGSRFGIAKIDVAQGEALADLKAMVFWGSVKTLGEGNTVSVADLAAAPTLFGSAAGDRRRRSAMEIYLGQSCYAPITGPFASFNIEFSPANQYFRNFYIRHTRIPALAVLDSKQKILIDEIASFVVFQGGEFYSLMGYVNAMLARGEWNTPYRSAQSFINEYERDVAIGTVINEERATCYQALKNDG